MVSGHDRSNLTVSIGYSAIVDVSEKERCKFLLKINGRNETTNRIRVRKWEGKWTFWTKKEWGREEMFEQTQAGGDERWEAWMYRQNKMECNGG